MAAGGLSKEKCDSKNYAHVTALADFALDLLQQLQNINEHSFNNFTMRIGKQNQLARYPKINF